MPEPHASQTPSNRIGAFIALVFCAGSGVFSLWIGLTGQEVSGGLPFLPPAWNQQLGHVVFACAGVICLGIARLAWRDVVRPAAPRAAPRPPRP
jgi:hypothetical protein